MAYIGRTIEMGMFEKQILTPDSATTTFSLTYAVGSANSLLVVYGGVCQEPGVAYSVSGGGQSIAFSEAPETGTTLYIIYFGKQLTTPRAAGQETSKQTFAGDGTTSVFTLTDPPVVPAGVMVFVDGILQREGSGNNYVSSGSIITFSVAPDSSAEIDVYTLVKEKVSIDTVADGSITETKLSAGVVTKLNTLTPDATGNLGVGVTPSAWRASSSNERALQVTNTALYNQQTSGASVGMLLGNSFLNSSSAYKYNQSYYATRYALDNSTGQHEWSTAPSGSAAGTITFTQRMTLDNSGRLLVGVNSATGSNLLQVNSDASIYGITVGRGAGAVSGNTAVGASALGANTTGADNSAFGLNALSSNTTGNYNTALGRQALTTSTTASNNTAVGYQAGVSITTGGDNAIFGHGAFSANTTGNQNTVVGRAAMDTNTTGADNTALGFVALQKNTTGSYNTALGDSALRYNTTASNNTAVGYQAGYSNTTGFQNTATGVNALYSNTTGSSNTAYGRDALYANTTASNNTAYGLSALQSNTTGAQNVALGHSALFSNTTTSNNTAVGYQALYSQTTPSAANSGLGYQAGYSITTGIQNTCMGTETGRNLTTGSGNTFLGHGSGYYMTTGAKNTIVGKYDGNSGGLDIRTASNYIVLSDGDGNPRGIFDGSGNLGIGTTSPASRLDVKTVSTAPLIRVTTNADGSGSAQGGLQWFETNSGAVSASITGTRGGGYYNQTNMIFSTADGGANTERARIDSSGNLIVGGTTATNTAANRGNITINGTSSAILSIGTGGTARGVVYHSGSDMIINATTGTLALQANSNGALIDTSGNLGLGVTPSAWGSGSKGFQVLKGGLWHDNSQYFALVNNAYYDGTNWKYISTAASSQITQINGESRFYNAASGSAGNNISFTQAMTLDASSNLLVGNTTSLYYNGKLQITGGKTIINSTDNSFGQFQLGNSGSNSEASMQFISGVTAFGASPTSTNGNNFCWNIGAGNYNIGGDSFGVGNKGIGGINVKLAYNSSSWISVSDERIKDIESDITNAYEIVKDWRTVYYTLKSDPLKITKIGLLAQDVQKTLPMAVDIPKIETDNEGKLNPWGVHYTDVIPVLVKAIQEQQALIESMASKLRSAGIAGF